MGHTTLRSPRSAVYRQWGEGKSLPLPLSVACKREHLSHEKVPRHKYKYAPTCNLSGDQESETRERERTSSRKEESCAQEEGRNEEAADANPRDEKEEKEEKKEKEQEKQEKKEEKEEKARTNEHREKGDRTEEKVCTSARTHERDCEPFTVTGFSNTQRDTRRVSGQC